MKPVLKIRTRILDPDWIPFCLPREAVEEVEHALAPRVHRVVGLEQADGRYAARPLERAEQDVVGVARAVAAEERVLHEPRPRHLEHAAEVCEPLLRLGAGVLEPPAQALL